MHRMKKDEMTFPFDSDPADILAVDSFVKCRVGNMCYVSALSEDKGGAIEIGIWGDDVMVDQTGERRLRFVGYDNVFEGRWREGGSGLEMVFPTRAEMERRISDHFDK